MLLFEGKQIKSASGEKMNITLARKEVLESEKIVTESLSLYGENSSEYKKALKSFGQKWVLLKQQINDTDFMFHT